MYERRPSGTDQPLTQRGVEAAGNRVFALPFQWRKGSNLEVRLRARRIGSDHPDRVEPASGDGRGLQSQDRLCVCEQQCHQPGPLSAHCASTT